MTAAELSFGDIFVLVAFSGCLLKADLGLKASVWLWPPSHKFQLATEPCELEALQWLWAQERALWLEQVKRAEDTLFGRWWTLLQQNWGQGSLEGDFHSEFHCLHWQGVEQSCSLEGWVSPALIQTAGSSSYNQVHKSCASVTSQIQ